MHRPFCTIRHTICSKRLLYLQALRNTSITPGHFLLAAVSREYYWSRYHGSLHSQEKKESLYDKYQSRNELAGGRPGCRIGCTGISPVTDERRLKPGSAQCLPGGLLYSARSRATRVSTALITGG